MRSLECKHRGKMHELALISASVGAKMTNFGSMQRNAREVRDEFFRLLSFTFAILLGFENGFFTGNPFSCALEGAAGEETSLVGLGDA